MHANWLQRSHVICYIHWQCSTVSKSTTHAGCRISFDVREEEDFQQIAAALPNLVNVGMSIPVSWAQRKLSIPAAQNGEPVLVATKTPIKTDAIA
jgi:phage gp29-like protein